MDLQAETALRAEGRSWREIAVARPAAPRDPADPAYRSPALDAALADAAGRGIAVSLLVLRTPAWANGGRSQAHAPRQPRDLEMQQGLHVKHRVEPVELYAGARSTRSAARDAPLLHVLGRDRAWRRQQGGKRFEVELP